MSIIDLGKTAMAEGPSAIEWTDSNFLEMIFWFRFIVSVAAGVACGVSQVTGAYPLFAFGGTLALSALSIIQRVGQPKGVNVDQTDLLKEGLFESLMAFLFFWTVSTTMLAA